MMKIKNGYKVEMNGWKFVSIKGNPRERGFAHGYLLANEIQEAIDTLKYNFYDSYGIEFDFFIEISNFFFKRPTEENFPEFFEELVGIHEGANKNGSKCTLDELILWNNSSSIGYVLPKLSEYLNQMPELEQKYGDYIKTMNGSVSEGGSKDKCSAFMAVGSYTEDGKICCAHNSFDDFLSGQFFNIILDVNPTNGNRFIFQAGPGYITSMTDFFVTSNGFIGTETTIGGFNTYAYGDPITCRSRNCMQYAKTLDDFVTLFTLNNSGDYANSWLIGDTKNNEIMRIELGLNYVNVERLKDGYFIGFNAPYDPRIRNLECVNTGYDDIRRHQGARKVRLDQLMEQHKGKINIEIAQDIIADHYDVFLNTVNPCSRTCCSHYDLDNRAFMSQADRPLPYQPRGAVDGIVCDTTMAKQMSFCARWGNSCGIPFNKDDFFKRNIQWKRFSPYIHDRPSQPWVVVKSDKSFSSSKKQSKRQTKSLKNRTIKK